MAVPLIFGERVERVLVFAKSQPNWFEKGDGEIDRGVALHVVVAIQHQRLAEEQRRLAVVDRRICRVTLEHSGLLQRPPS